MGGGRERGWVGGGVKSRAAEVPSDLFVSIDVYIHPLVVKALNLLGLVHQQECVTL